MKTLHSPTAPHQIPTDSSLRLWHRRARLHAALLATAVLAACGGGGGNDGAVDGATSATRVASCGLSGGALRIMPFGDSITEGEAGHNTYRRVLWQRLQAAGCNVDLVGTKYGVSSGYRNSPSKSPPNGDFDLDHEGYWDYHVNEVIPLAASSAAAAQPDIVLIHIGTNDVLAGQGASGIAAEISSLVGSLRSGKSNMYILLAKIVPATPNTAGTAALNRQIDSIASKLNSATSPVIVVDQASGYSTADNYDGVHPAPSGESKIGNRWASAVLGLRTN
ncbi:MAG: SGNH/GDSL hydrolase family protein [Burkholderiaceae bacterium]